MRHGFPYQPTALAFDPVQKILAIGSRSGGIRMYPFTLTRSLTPSCWSRSREQKNLEITVYNLLLLPLETRCLLLLQPPPSLNAPRPTPKTDSHGEFSCHKSCQPAHLQGRWGTRDQVGVHFLINTLFLMVPSGTRW